MNLTKKNFNFLCRNFQWRDTSCARKKFALCQIDECNSVSNQQGSRGSKKKLFCFQMQYNQHLFSFCKFQAAKLSTKCLVSSPSSTKAKCTKSARREETSMTDLGAPPAPIKNTNTNREVALGVIVTQSCAKAIVILGWQADGPVHFFLKPWLSLNFLTERSVTLPGKGNL